MSKIVFKLFVFFKNNKLEAKMHPTYAYYGRKNLLPYIII